MIQIFSLMVVSIFAVGFIAMLARLLQGRGQWTQAFEKIATRYGGWYSSARLARPPAATFTYKGADVRVRCRRRPNRQNRRETEFRIVWPRKVERMEVVTRGQIPDVRALRNLAPWPTDDETFNASFDVYIGGRTPDIGRRLLSSGVRWQIQQLALFMDGEVVRVFLDRGLLTVRKRGFVKSAQGLDDFVRYCLELYDQMTLTTSEGIEFREDVLMSVVDDVHCPICSSDIEGRMVVCVRCKTPHCLECWQYNTRCGMYACNETRYMMVGSGTAAQDS